MVPKRPVRKVRMVGTSNRSYDLMHAAKAPGWRRSREGNYYFENRANRSDLNKKKRL